MKTVTVCAQSVGNHEYALSIWPGDENARASGSCWNRLGEFEQHDGENDRAFLLRVRKERDWPQSGDLSDFV